MWALETWDAWDSLGVELILAGLAVLLALGVAAVAISAIVLLEMRR